jgi:hypothetical protein
MSGSLATALGVAVLLTVTPVTVLPAMAQGPGAAVVVDDRDGGFTPRGFGWLDGDGGYGGEHYSQLAVHGRANGQVGVWRATLPDAGRYKVQARIPPRHAHHDPDVDPGERSQREPGPKALQEDTCRVSVDSTTSASPWPTWRR